MNENRQRAFWRRVIAVLAAAIVLIALVAAFAQYRASWPRGEALHAALGPVIEQGDTEKSIAARAILDNYLETRKNASRWSGIHWGFTFVAAALSALAGLLLKLESVLKDEKVKKDVAAVLAVVAAILITVSTSGDFARKWQANRIAAAELERAGYEFLAKDGANPRSYLSIVGEILERRHRSIVGASEQPSQAVPEPARAE